MTNTTKEAAELTDERKAFEKWYVCNAFNYSRDPIGSRDCSLQWDAWKARALLSAQANDAKAQEDAKDMAELLYWRRCHANDMGYKHATDCLSHRDRISAIRYAAIQGMQTGSGE